MVITWSSCLTTPREQPAEQREAAPRTSPEEEPLPSEDPSTGTSVATIRTAGLEFSHPAYLENIIVQVYRRWRRPESSRALEAEVQFFIHRDGSISNPTFVKRSGNFGFDLEAQGAIEAAGRAKAFGALPDDFPEDILLVSFFFRPERGGS